MFWNEDEMVNTNDVHAMYVIPPPDGGCGQV
jgi:hypothetical protein